MATVLVSSLAACATTTRSHEPPVVARPRAMDLVPLLSLDNRLLVETSALIARAGERAAVEEAGRRLAQIATSVSANTEPQYRHRALIAVYDAMKPLRANAIERHCRWVAQADGAAMLHRNLALGVLQAQGLAGPPIAEEQPVSLDSKPDEASRDVVRAPSEGEGNGAIPDASAVIERMRARFRACYEASLERRRPQFGRTEAHVTVLPDGQIGKVRVSAPSTIDDEMAQCLTDVIEDASFAPPTGGKKAMVVIMINFVVEPTGDQAPTPRDNP